MESTLGKVCALQPKYSSTNTPEMQERGHLIRSVLAGELRTRLPALQKAFDSVFDDLAVEGSDGIGRKTEAPWVRVFSRAMSPTAREGFYLVIHFAADGSAVFITVGCGSTIWSGGDLRPVSDDELKARTSWARSVVQQRWKALSPFDDEIVLGARASLPRTFEKATVFAKRIPVSDLPTANLDLLLFKAAERLSEIYLAQLERRDVSPGDQDAGEITVIAKPLRNRAGKQGRGLTAQERRVVELQAMALAMQYLVGQGYELRDTSATESFDILAKRAVEELMVEVKGTTSDLCTSVLMTKNEVDLHRKNKGSTGLIIVSKIRLSRDAGEPVATGGEVEALLCWDIDEWTSEPIAFQVSRKAN
ncbi:hypothetical protein PF66_05786 [Pseudomonas asplenii]|uniref:Uncharacterized protein n=1 Tax=Pseudomonas asplenii TaxID=53407 RepID=A0A0M9GCQ1_9PSED|nr:DUF3578 domain-containing protein [Pseudomonas fuscovaginae]KPA87828.1 hypothetical protein PF66_05786 [Pseudomonas fuscovaginae]